MSNINDGGLAFPGTRSEQVNMFVDSEGSTIPTYADCEYPGMTLRDYFAAAMMTRIGIGWPNEENRSVLATQAYQMADAMIAARSVYGASLEQGR